MSDEEMEYSDTEVASTSTAAPAQQLSSAGKIHSIYLKNFMTHGEITVRPGQELNIVIGPNGTGKSAIVAGIIIGMGGSTKILSEHNKLCDYVKNGKDQAATRIVLHRDDNGGKVRFERHFGRDNKSAFAIDGKKCTEKQYLAAVNDLNIQVGNLCQFLPQERVQDFAKQNAQQLFMSTQKSVCSDELNDDFDNLKQMRSLHLNGGKRLQQIQGLLEQNERRVELLQSVVDDICRRDTLAKTMDVIEKKLAWMDYESEHDRYKVVDADLKIAKNALAETTQKKKELDKRLAELDSERGAYEKRLDAEATKSKQCQREVERIAKEIDAAEYEMLRAGKELAEVENTAADYSVTMAENKLVLKIFQKEMDDHLLTIESVESVRQEMLAIDEQVREEKAKLGGLVEDRHKVNTRLSTLIVPEIKSIENKIHQLETIEAAKVARLEEISADARKALDWLRSNKAQFKGKVHEPIMLTMSVRTRQYVPYVENVIGRRDLVAFMCEDIDDMSKFMKIVRKDMGLNVNVVHSPGASSVHFKPATPIDDLKSLGAQAYLIEHIDAPPTVINFLCKAYKLHNVLVGTSDLEHHTDKLPDHLQLFYFDDYRFSITKSRFTGKPITMSSCIEPKDLLNVEINEKLLNELKQTRAQRVRESDKVRNQRAHIELAIQKVHSDCETKFKEKNEWQQKIYQHEGHARKVQQQRAKLERLDSEAIDVDGAKQQYADRKGQILATLRANADTLVDKYEAYGQQSLRVCAAKGRLDVFKSSTRTLDVEVMECDEELNRRKSYCSRIADLVDQQKRKCKEKRDIAKKMTDNRQPTDGDQFPYKKAFEELSGERDVLLEELDTMATQMAGRSANDQRTIDEYNEKRTVIEKLRREVAEAGQASGDMEREMDELHKRWYPQVQQMVDSINRMFGQFMASMQCAGEIELIHPTEYDYEQYGIEIRVQYRNNAGLCKLDRFVQSGGERAVAIAVYSLSLQHLSQVPFRCVDEINQGMDQRNECRIFEMLVNHVAKPRQSQFFYVTPKLQPNLPYNDYVTCITIFNGRTMAKGVFDKCL